MVGVRLGVVRGMEGGWIVVCGRWWIVECEV